MTKVRGRSLRILHSLHHDDALLIPACVCVCARADVGHADVGRRDVHAARADRL